jgi:hypothetical protein
MFALAAIVTSARRSSAFHTETFSAVSPVEIIDVFKAVAIVATERIDCLHATVDARVIDVRVVTRSMIAAE